MTQLSLRYFGLLAALFAPILGCGSGTTSVTTEPHPSILEVSPEEFSDNVPCAPGGGLRLYVATLFDVTPKSSGGATGSGGAASGAQNEGSGGSETSAPVGGAAAAGGSNSTVVPFALPSSRPTPCEQAVGFGWIVYGHSYYARIEGYDREDLDPLDRGVPILVDRITREPVEPRWRSSCGSIEKPVSAETQVTRRLADCTDWSGETAVTPTRVQVGIDAALQGRGCGAEAGLVETFSVRQSGELVGSAACGEQIVLENVLPGEFVSLSVLGYEAGSTAPRYGTTCTATALSGVTLTAHCEAFAETGTLSVNLETALAAVGARCDASLDSLVLELGPNAAEHLTVGESDCRGTARFFDLAPGEYGLTLTARVEGSGPRVAMCSANVEPGLSSEALCETP